MRNGIKNVKLAPSMMCCDFFRLKEQTEAFERSNIELLHIDIMDGCFVPNITLGFDLVNSIKSITDIPLDVHMMVNEPSRFIDRMNLNKNDYLCVHCESEVHIQRTLSQIREKGCKTGMAINPQTPVESMKYLTDYIDMALVMTVSPGFAGQKIFAGAERKVSDARKFLDECGYSHIPIEVDGNISVENGAKLSRCGAEIFVLGTSSLFLKGKTLKQAATEFREVL